MSRHAPLAYLNGRFMPQSEANLTLHDAGFVMGVTVTDLCRTFKQRLYRWPDHLARFRASCRAVELEIQASDDEITSLATDLVAQNAAPCSPQQELSLVLFATPGPIGYYLGEPGGPGDGPVTFGMHTFPLPFDRYRNLVRQGANLVVPRVRQVSSECVDPRIKMRSRMHWWLADREVRRSRPGAIALLLNGAGHVTETAAANLLLVKDGTVFSPPPDQVLSGVSVQVVRELCAALGVPFDERPLVLDDCLAADEAMLTSTPYCLAGVKSIQGTELAFPGPVTIRLCNAWSQHVGTNIWGQMVGE